ncbi:nucleotidyltransferase domain-containing protein [Paenibacillus glacialis]|uniref:Polymerase nucleotidyl transferase domain-containing protein n=1 Tax=Paenibacillus glacialis TaxID=494026 RepID=A0A162MFQ0_9BACL|nr:nucleotidyltransferase domain-containing protein [Paenibacillus glacialis]OAB43733.1 hypothetical protein PGLA_08095 [Paenibacillus glacialis]
MNEHSKKLLQRAYFFAEQLSEHEILKEYWNELSLILKGSVARGNSDQYSDIDFVFFCNESVRLNIFNQFYNNGLSHRQDWVFIAIGDWEGHYHFESYNMLEEYYRSHSLTQIWEFQSAIPIHDPLDRFQLLFKDLSDRFLNNWTDDIREKYVDLFHTLDWMRHPLKRGDFISSNLHCSKFLQDICRISYLLDNKCYPHDKWVSTYLNTTRFGNLYRKSIESFVDSFPNSGNININLELENYSCYLRASELINHLGNFIKDNFENYPWIERWYEYKG